MTVLDTLSIARSLRDAGFSEKQAEAVAGAVRQAAGAPDLSPLATKQELRAELAELEVRIQRLIITVVTGGVIFNAIVIVGSMFGLAKLLGH
jgi:DNA-binding transcriptional MerR regulator